MERKDALKLLDNVVFIVKHNNDWKRLILILNRYCVKKLYLDLYDIKSETYYIRLFSVGYDYLDYGWGLKENPKYYIGYKVVRNLQSWFDIL